MGKSLSLTTIFLCLSALYPRLNLAQDDVFLLPNGVESVVAHPEGLLLWTKNQYKLLHGRKDNGPALSLDSVEGIVVSSTGVVFGVERTGETASVLEIRADGRTEIHQSSLNALIRTAIVINQSGEKLWLILYSKYGTKLTEISTKTKAVIIERTLPADFDRFGDCLYVANLESLLVGRADPLNHRWEIFKVEASQDTLKKVLQIDETVVLRVAATATGDLIVGARNELHQPDKGFLSRIQGRTFTQLWRRAHVIPMDLVVWDNHIFITEGGDRVLVLSDEEGKQIGDLDFGDVEIVSLAINSAALWAIAADAGKVASYHDPGGIIKKLTESRK